MAKRKTEKKTHAGTGHVCAECRKGAWNYENLNYEGKPFIIYCGHSTYAHTRAGIGLCLDNTPACDCFEEGKKEGGI